MISQAWSRSRSPSVPRIYASSITTPAFRWLHEEAWDEPQKVAFSLLRQAPAAPLMAPPPLVHQAKKPAPLTIGRWLLVPPLSRSSETASASGPSAAVAAIAAAEAQLTQTQYTNITLLLSPCQTVYAHWCDEGAKAALTLLISSLILMSRADLIRLIPLSDKVLPQLGALGLSQSHRDLWVPLHSMVMLAGGPSRMHLSSIDIDPGEWWALPFAAQDRSTLSYLEKRLAAQEKTAEPRSDGRRRRGFFQLFNRRR